VLRGAVAIPAFRPHRLAVGDAVTPALDILNFVDCGLAIVRMIPMLPRFPRIVSKDFEEGSKLYNWCWKLLFQNVRPDPERQTGNYSIR